MDFRELVKVGAHFGHIKSRLNPKMNIYIWGVRNNVHLIDVSKTAFLLGRAVQFLEKVAVDGKPILWVGTKKSAREAIKTTAQKLDMPYVCNRWIGGTLSNYSQVKKSVTKLLHYEDILSKTEKFPHYTKKELNVFTKIVERLKRNIGGIRKLTWPIGAVVLVDVVKELSALKEAATVGLPVVAIVDTNGDPTLVDYVIPANDDSAKTVDLIVNYLSDAVQKGKDVAAAAKETEREAVKAKKVKTAVDKKVGFDKKASADKKEKKVIEKKVAKPVKKTVKASEKPVEKPVETKKAEKKADTAKEKTDKKPAAKK